MFQLNNQLQERFSKVQLGSEDFENKIVRKMFLDTSGYSSLKIVNVYRLYNKNVQERFKTELKIQAGKHKGKEPFQLVKLLFHGSRNSPPEQIYGSEDGLDMRFSRAGYYG